MSFNRDEPKRSPLRPFAEAQTGGTVAIPVSEYAARIAPTEQAAALQDHLRTEPDGFSRAEAQEWQATRGEQLQADLDRAASEAENADAFRASADRVRDTIKAQLTQAGVFREAVNDAYATVPARFYAVTAARLGLTPEQLYQQYPLTVGAQLPTQGAVFNQAAKAIDAGYLAAVERGDTETAQRLVNEAAAAAGYSPGSDFRMNHTAPNSTDGFSQSMATVRGSGLVPDDYWTHPQYYQSDSRERVAFSSLSAMFRAMDARSAAGQDPGAAPITVYRAVPKSSKEGAIRNGDWVTLSEAYARDEGAYIPGGFRIISQVVSAKNLYWDGNSAAELGYDNGKGYAYKNTKNNRKLLDAVTRDADGNVVPLSQRFNARKSEEYYQSGADGVQRLIGMSPVSLDGLAPLSDKKAIEQAFRGFGMVENGTDHRKVNFPASMAGKIVRHRGFELGRVAGAFDSLLAGAVPMFSEREQQREGHKAHPEIAWYHHYASKFEQNGREFYVRFTVQEMRAKPGNTGENLAHSAFVSDVSIYEKGAAPESAGVRDNPVLTEGTTPLDKRLAQWLADGNAEFAHLLLQGNAAPRGAYNPATFNTAILKGADLSTFLHETGHHFLEMQLQLAAQLAARETLTAGEQSLVADSHALLKWFGVRDIAEWQNMPFEERRAHHETFARGFEAYLYEGKAPSVELNGLFQRLRAWLVNVYKDLKNLNVELTPEVRGVMDRMVATTEEITMAEQARGMLPMFESAIQAGMTPEEWADYQQQGVQPTLDAIDDLQARGSLGTSSPGALSDRDEPESVPRLAHPPPRCGGFGGPALVLDRRACPGARAVACHPAPDRGAVLSHRTAGRQRPRSAAQR